MDKLYADFSAQSKAQIDLEDTIHDLEQECARQDDLAAKVKGSDKVKHEEVRKETTAKLLVARTQLEHLKLKKDTTSTRLEEAQQELAKVKVILPTSGQ